MSYDIFISENTKKNIESTLKSASHSLILESPKGSTYRHLSSYIEKLTKVIPDTSTIITPEKKSIGIEQIKSLRLQFALKNSVSETRLVFINDSQLLTHESQNALLKTLEEPPKGTIFILHTTSSDELLPTVRSRSALIIATKPNSNLVADYFLSKGFKTQEIKSALAISDGWPELAESILNNESTNFMEELAYAKDLLQYNLTNKLREIDSISKNKDRIPLLLFALERIAVSANKAQILSKGVPSERWVNIMETVAYSQELFDKNVSNRVLLTNLMMKL